MSISSDVTGTDEEERKGGTPKEEISCRVESWALGE